jgi:putative ABC transport system permease protein
VAVSENFVMHFGLPADLLLHLPAASGMLELPIVAVVPDYVSDKGSVLLSRDKAAAEWNDQLVNFFAVSLSPGAAESTLQQEVLAGVPQSGRLSVMSTAQMIARVDGFIGKAFADIDTIKLLVLFLTAVGITDLVVSNVLSRRRELAVLRIVGLVEGDVIRSATLESLCITIAAAVCGSVVGVICAWLWVHYNYPALVGYVLQLRIAWDGIAIAVVLSAFTAIAAAMLSARFALRQPALATIRFES